MGETKVNRQQLCTELTQSKKKKIVLRIIKVVKSHKKIKSCLLGRGHSRVEVLKDRVGCYGERGSEESKRYDGDADETQRCLKGRREGERGPDR